MIDFKNKTYILDGAMGTMLQRAGMTSGEDPNAFLANHTDVVRDVHRSYVEAGSDIIYAPTFNLNRRTMSQLGEGLSDYVCKLIQPAVSVREEMATKGREIIVALDMGPLGEMLEPLGSLTFEDAYDTFAELVKAGVGTGVDIIVIETMTDLYEVRAALLAAKENSDLPVIVSMSFDEGGRTFTGTGLEAMALTLDSLGVDAMGINCSLGPEQILPLIKELMEYTDTPVFAKPNAGLPDPATGEYDIGSAEFAATMRKYLDAGVHMVGGCCGTTPEYIKAIVAGAGALPVAEHPGAAAEADVTVEREPAGADTLPAATNPPKALRVSARATVVKVDRVTVIGERMNPTGKKRMKQALLDGDLDYVLSQAIEQEEAGAHILDLNVGIPGLDEVAMMPKVVKAVQSVTDLPLQIDSSNPAAIEAALRVYNGKAIVNSVNGEEKSLNTILPIVEKYGAAVIGLTLDEKGIPESADERIAIAERILQKAKEYGIPREDVIIDCLTLTASAQQKDVDDTLKAVRRVKEEMGLSTALGVSNVSFGLPMRPLINRTFLTMALENGLDLPIINPNDEDMMAQIFAFNVLKNRDINGEAFIDRYAGRTSAPSVVNAADMTSGPAAKATATSSQSAAGVLGSARPSESADGNGMVGSAPADPNENSAGDLSRRLFRAVEKGLAAETVNAVKGLLESREEMDVIEQDLIPALDNVGRKFEAGTLFLPQMLQSATAAQTGFEIIKEGLARKGKEDNKLGEVVVATVKGDIHDIGKNIVKVIIDNYGFRVIDLGRNVPAEDILKKVKERNIRLVGLSALMTTTLGSMKETIDLIKAEVPSCKVMVGGAVLTEDYARSIGADYYCKDAMKSVEAAREVFG